MMMQGYDVSAAVPFIAKAMRKAGHKEPQEVLEDFIRRAIEADRLTSSIFFGPPGCGKTTLASIIAGATKAAFVQLNAVTSGVADVREVLKYAQERRALYGQATYLLLDECHR